MEALKADITKGVARGSLVCADNEALDTPDYGQRPSSRSLRERLFGRE